MAYDIHDGTDAAHVRFAGALTFAEHRKVRSVVTRLERHPARTVVFDLSRVDYIDAAGLGLLLVARDTVATKGGRAELSGASGQVGRMLQLARFGEVFRGEVLWA